MNFDDIQAAWNNDNGGNPPMPDDLSKLKPAGLTLTSIKQRMYHEGIVQAGGIVVIGFYPQIFHLDTAFVAPFYAVYALLVLVCLRYFLAFRALYKRINPVTLNSRDSLYETYYDIRLGIEMYKACSYALSPLAVAIVFFLLFGTHWSSHEMKREIMRYVFLASAIILFVFIIIATEWWVKYYYAAPLKEIKKVLDEFKEK
ncbi:hypothetical protein [Chitinophaga vietnamensis]|uniref:hypothetical protein n=1 Tax=Chitinophaga vietnamensis TaxID=2593957 RepID=UPI00117755B7|nr:hypothetical protein [Chitinophaga vietnamensis]